MVWSGGFLVDFRGLSGFCGLRDFCITGGLGGLKINGILA